MAACIARVLVTNLLLQQNASVSMAPSATGTGTALEDALLLVLDICHVLHSIA